MADALSQLAELWGQRKPAAEPTPGGLPPELVQRLLASAEKPKLEKDMSFGGAEIQIPIDKVPAKPVSEIQTMEPTVISADAPSGPESKYNMLNRILGVIQTKEAQFEPDPAMKARVDSTFQNLHEKANAPRRGLDLPAIEARAAARNPSPEWSQSDYLKAALVATLPALAGGLAGGLGGAMGGSKGGVKGTDEILKQDAELRKNHATKKSDDVKNHIEAFKAETDARGKEIKTLGELVKLEVETYGKISDPTRKFLQEVLPEYAQAEVNTYEEELKQQGNTERKVIGESAEDEREANRELGRNDRAKAGISTKEDQFGQSLDEKRRQFNTSLESKEAIAAEARALKERLAKESNKIKASAAASKAAGTNKPPTQAQTVAANFNARMAEADKLIDKYYKTGKFDATAKENFIINSLPGRIRNFAQNPDAQNFEKAKREWITAKLRPESGAAIGDSEFERDDLTYFPQPNDSSQVVAEKSRSRKQVEAGFRAAAGEQANKNVSDQKIGIKEMTPAYQNPKIAAYAKKHGIAYETAKLLIEKREAGSK